MYATTAAGPFLWVWYIIPLPVGCALRTGEGWCHAQRVGSGVARVEAVQLHKGVGKVKEELFKVWLSGERELNVGTVGSRISNCKRVEYHEGDLDAHYDADGLVGLMDRLNAKRPEHRVPINGNIYNGTATLKSAVGLYRDFRAVPGTSKSHVEDTPKRLRKDEARYKSLEIGNAQNGLVRNLLGRLGDHSFTQGDWERVRDDTFGKRCAYCGAADQLEMEHAIPINMEKLGEHHLGNLVPACKRCNRDKGNQDYAEFLAAQPERKQAIDAHMARSRYRPLRRNGLLVRALLRAAHQETRAVAERYATLLRELDEQVARAPARTDS